MEGHILAFKEYRGRCVPYQIKGERTMQNELVIHGIYKHFKGNYVIVEDVAIHSETGEKYVVYRALYEDCKLLDHMICFYQK